MARVVMLGLDGNAKSAPRCSSYRAEILRRTDALEASHVALGARYGALEDSVRAIEISLGVGGAAEPTVVKQGAAAEIPGILAGCSAQRSRNSCLEALHGPCERLLRRLGAHRDDEPASRKHQKRDTLLQRLHAHSEGEEYDLPRRCRQ